MQTVTLYTKLECHLCEDAYQILLDLTFEIPLEIDVIDITHTHSNLEAEYGARIPVLALPNGIELNWPFTVEDVRAQLTRP